MFFFSLSPTLRLFDSQMGSRSQVVGLFNRDRPREKGKKILFFSFFPLNPMASRHLPYACPWLRGWDGPWSQAMGWVCRHLFLFRSSPTSALKLPPLHLTHPQPQNENQWHLYYLLLLSSLPCPNHIFTIFSGNGTHTHRQTHALHMNGSNNIIQMILFFFNASSSSRWFKYYAPQESIPEGR